MLHDPELIGKLQDLRAEAVTARASGRRKDLKAAQGELSRKLSAIHTHMLVSGHLSSGSSGYVENLEDLGSAIDGINKNVDFIRCLGDISKSKFSVESIDAAIRMAATM